jgi:hypothetical protein
MNPKSLVKPKGLFKVAHALWASRPHGPLVFTLLNRQICIKNVITSEKRTFVWEQKTEKWDLMIGTEFISYYLSSLGTWVLNNYFIFQNPLWQ